MTPALRSSHSKPTGREALERQRRAILRLPAGEERERALKRVDELLRKHGVVVCGSAREST